MTRVRDLHEKWMRDPNYRAAYGELCREFQSVRAAMRTVPRHEGAPEKKTARRSSREKPPTT